MNQPTPSPSPAPRFDDPTAPAPVAENLDMTSPARTAPDCPPGWRMLADGEPPQAGDFARARGTTEWYSVGIPSMWNAGGQRHPDLEFRRKVETLAAPPVDGNRDGDRLRDRANALAWLEARVVQCSNVSDVVHYLFDARREALVRLDALGRILLDMSENTHGFNFETVEARAHTVARQARGFRDIAVQAVKNSENLTLDQITGIVLSYITRNEQQAKMITEDRAELETLREATERQRVIIDGQREQIGNQAEVFEKLKSLAGLEPGALEPLIQWAEKMAASEVSEQATRLANQSGTIAGLQAKVSSLEKELKLTGECATDRQQTIWNLEASVKRGADLLEKQAASLDEYAANAQGQREFIVKLEQAFKEEKALVEDLRARDKRLTAKLETLEGEVPTTALAAKLRKAQGVSAIILKHWGILFSAGRSLGGDTLQKRMDEISGELTAELTKLEEETATMPPPEAPDPTARPDLNKTVFWPTPAEIIRGKLEQPARTKPPLGLKPLAIHNAQRRQEIIEAMKRFTLAKTPTPAEWLEELETLV